MIVMAAGTQTDITVGAITMAAQPAVRFEFAIPSNVGGRDAAIDCRVGSARLAQEAQERNYLIKTPDWISERPPRGGHQPHQQAGHMTAPDQCRSYVRKFLPRRRPHMTQL